MRCLDISHIIVHADPNTVLDLTTKLPPIARDQASTDRARGSLLYARVAL